MHRRGTALLIGLTLVGAVLLSVGAPAMVALGAAGIRPAPEISSTIDAPGAQQWVRRYNGPGNGQDVATALGMNPDGSTVFVTGYSTGSTGGFDYATVAYDASTGSKRWVRRYNGPGNGDDWGFALAVSPDGSAVFVTGRSPGSTTGLDYATVAYDASTGVQKWVRRYNGPANGDDIALALAASPDGSTVFVTGSSYSSATNFDYATVAYAASTGAKRWVRVYNGPGNGEEDAHALAVSPDGSTVFVTGSSAGSAAGDFDYATVAYVASTGAQLWASLYTGPATLGSIDFAYALAVSPDGSTVFVTGESMGSTTHYDYATVAYAASTGAQPWASRYNGSGNRDDTATAIRVSPDGSTVFVTGDTYSSTTVVSDYTTIAYDASTGGQLWASLYNGPGNINDDAYALGISPDGSTVFVTGRAGTTPKNVDYATVAYDASTGVQKWVSLYNGPGNSTDIARALGVSPDGSTVFVTGDSPGSTTSVDYATVAYSVA